MSFQIQENYQKYNQLHNDQEGGFNFDKVLKEITTYIQNQSPRLMSMPYVSREKNHILLLQFRMDLN